MLNESYTPKTITNIDGGESRDFEHTITISADNAQEAIKISQSFFEVFVKSGLRLATLSDKYGRIIWSTDELNE